MLKGWKTVTYNAARFLMDSGIIAFLLTVDWATAGFSVQAVLWILAALSMLDKGVNLVLRYFTDTPIGVAEVK